MTRLDWTQAPRGYSLGLSRGVLYSSVAAVPWNGLVGAAETDTVTLTDHYFDGQQVLVEASSGDYEGVISAYTYPDELEMLETTTSRFGLSYRTHGEPSDQIHLLYNASLGLPVISRTSLGQAVNTATFNWNVKAVGVPTLTERSISHLVIDVDSTDSQIIDQLENWLYGTASTDPRLPSPQEVVDLFESITTLRITQNGDGTYTASGPDDVVTLLGDGRFQIAAPSLYALDNGRFVVQSY